MKSISLALKVVLFAKFLGICLASLQNVDLDIKSNTSSQSVRCTTFEKLNFGMKLLIKFSYDPTANQVLSPLAFKLSLLAIASKSHDEQQAKAIFSLLYDSVRDFKPSRDYYKSANQNVELCRSFGVNSHYDCLQLIASEEPTLPQNHTENIEQMRECTSETTWQVARTDDKLIYQFLFMKDSFGNVEDHKWKSTLEWNGLKMFDLRNAKEVNKWKKFKRNSLSGLLSREFGYFAFKIVKNHTQHNHLLDIVMFDLKLGDQFTIGKRYFYGPKFNLTNQEQIFQIETLLNYGDKFGVVVHRDAETFQNHTLIRLSYEDFRFSLVLVLPDKNSTIPEMLRGLTSVQLEHYLQLLHTEKRRIVHLSLPNFSFVGKANINSLGLNITGFNLKSQNGAALKPILLENVQQFIRVTNYGADEKNLDMRTLDPVENRTQNVLRFNRPFMYMLISKNLDQRTLRWSFEILVTGFYNGPEQMIRL